MASSSKQVLRGLRTINAQQCISTRGFATTSTRALPRAIPRRTTTSSNDAIVERLNDPINPTRSAKGNEAGVSDTPWYIREQESFDNDVEPEEFASTQPVNPADLEPEVELPTALQGLHELLQEGPPSPLIARPDDGPYESETGRRPIKYIHAKQDDVQAWCDWIVVVQVRTSAGSTVSRVAKEIGEYLADQRPPTDESTKAAAEIKKKNAKANWQPFKILSREAQDGLRLLHASDPERWSRKELAETFKMSVESVRRVLRSKWQPSPAVVSRQNRRANERYEEKQQQQGWQGREVEEVERIKQSMLDSNRQSNIPQDDFNYDNYRVVDEEGRPVDEQKPFKQQITYEGLVPSANDAQSTRSSSRARNGLLRGDGEWCLVDAGWCVVHVMTPKARITYDVESQYNSNSLQIS
ncbi:uncharacterized protein FA14DRAFT_4586 [Meira miltonrushii]|uniref:Required for respiratory growth protein 9, mitochondrial n=1 Tax=Meira miltonrushii TaxID=1280837 RepID=A0A316VH79_9BASI|nr:uncharacterized protein FA14DRAFT_4586 [Meira miltonrushii]PWN36604.1 hypothetical protein FA14DRAFT_4586 [Meira miltonrushii]